MKRLIDIALSGIAVVIISPLLLLISLAIVADSGLPVLFRQERVGLSFRRFRIIKFRTMRNSAAGALLTVAGDHRVTRIGKYLRLMKLDELPQLWNVLVGDMSLVGPRPEVPQYVEMFSGRYREVLQIRPGITDLASVKYRDEELVLSRACDPFRHYTEHLLPAKLDLAETYVRNHTILGDLRILFLTVVRILKITGS